MGFQLKRNMQFVRMIENAKFAVNAEQWSIFPSGACLAAIKRNGIKFLGWKKCCIYCAYKTCSGSFWKIMTVLINPQWFFRHSDVCAVPQTPKVLLFHHFIMSKQLGRKGGGERIYKWVNDEMSIFFFLLLPSPISNKAIHIYSGFRDSSDHMLSSRKRMINECFLK